MGKKRRRQQFTSSSAQPAPAAATVAIPAERLERSNSDWRFPLLLAALTLLAYQRVWQSGFIWDDNLYVTLNTTLRDLGGLWRIWFEPTATPQYYPLVHTSFWLEYQLWQLNPLGFHIVNVLLHIGASVLLWRVLVTLRVPGAWIAAAIFALHPVEVESVAWISERKNVLSGVFYFAAALTYLKFAAAREAAEVGQRRMLLYAASLALFVCALLSKTVTCSLPVALLLVAWWKTGRIRLQDVLPTIPFFLVGFALALGTIWLEKHHVGAAGAAWSLSLPDRVVLAGRALWFYAFKLVWPAELTFIYPRWQISASVLWQWLFPFTGIVVVAMLWLLRGRIGRGPLVAVLFFATTLFPALGFIDVYPFRYSFVADHFQYLASVGIIVMAAAALSRLPKAVPAVLLAVLAFLTWQQVGSYRNLETLWRDTVAKNPGSWMAQASYAAVLMEKKQLDAAMTHLRAAEKIDPNNAEIQNNIGLILLQTSGPEEALPYFRKALQIEPDRAAAVQYNVGHALLLLGRPNESIPYLERALQIDHTYVPARSALGNAFLLLGRVEESYEHLQTALAVSPGFIDAHFHMANTLLQMGQVTEAVSHLERVLAMRPDDPDAQKNMAWVLATSPDPQLRDGARAVELAESANRRRQSSDPIVSATLASAYAEAGRFAEAVNVAEAALEAAEKSRNAALASLLRSQLALFRSGQPFRDYR
jgi:tetratricopeptide (TPR) repeat protein